MKRGGKIFGSILVILGVLFLLSELGILNEFYARYNITLGSIVSGLLNALMTLWPLALVALGVTILFRKEWVGRVAWAAFLVIIVVYACIFPGFMQHRGMMWLWGDNGQITQNFEKYSDAIDYTDSMKRGVLDIDVGAGSAVITSGKDKAARIESSGSRLSSILRVDGDTLKVDARNDEFFQNIGNLAGVYKIYLGEKLSWDIIVDTGASDFNADLRSLKIENLDFSMGAGSAVIHLGDLQPVTNVMIEAGASSITLYIPKESGIRIESESGLSSIKMEGGNLSANGESSYQSPDYDKADSKVRIDLSTGVSSVEIIREQ